MRVYVNDGLGFGSGKKILAWVPAGGGDAGAVMLNDGRVGRAKLAETVELVEAAIVGALKAGFSELHGSEVA